jgi:hypothetical protein
MADTGTFRTATLKPGIDKAIAKDGAQVVLWGDAEEAVLLRYADTRWLITRHPAVGPDRSAARVMWQGVQYAATGERVVEFSDAAALTEWRRFYEDFFRLQQARVRHCLVGNESHAA